MNKEADAIEDKEKAKQKSPADQRAKFLKVWQQLKFDSLSASPSKKAENLRKLIHQLKRAEKNLGEEIDLELAAKIEAEIHEKHSHLVGFREDKQHLNNYASEAQALAGPRELSGASWTCKIVSLDRIPWGQKLLQESREGMSTNTRQAARISKSIADLLTNCPKKETSPDFPKYPTKVEADDSDSEKLDQTVPESMADKKLIKSEPEPAVSSSAQRFKLRMKGKAKRKKPTASTKPSLPHHEKSSFLSASAHLSHRRQKRADQELSSSDEEESVNSWRKKQRVSGGGKISSYKRKPIKSSKDADEEESLVDFSKVEEGKPAYGKKIPKFQHERNFAFASARQQLAIERSLPLKRKSEASEDRENERETGSWRNRQGTCIGQLRKPSADHNQPFKPPSRGNSGDVEDKDGNWQSLGTQKSLSGTGTKLLEQKLLNIIESEIMVRNLDTNWSDISGLESAKDALKEIVVWPFLRPDLFCGLRSPPKGVLLFGPPGTGKTMIGKCIASECEATFFNISASTLTSKWMGEGEKLVRALFEVARQKLPAVIFIDEVDSLLSARSDSEHECSRRMKTEFLVQMDGLDTSADERLLVLGATNRPGELDEAARRRFSKRLYIALPEPQARKRLVVHELKKSDTANSLTEENLDSIKDITEGYSCADLMHLCRDASMWPLRNLKNEIRTVTKEELRPVCLEDFEKSLKNVKPTVSEADLGSYVDWNQKFGVS